METIHRNFSIDGNYFGQRCLGAINMGDKINNLETKQEKLEFKTALNSMIIDLWNTVSPYFDTIIFTTDNKSWRKEVEPNKPTWFPADDKRPIGYKEQRKAKKEESSINYDNFYELYREFIESLKNKMIVFDIEGLEGDDILMLLSSKIGTMSNLEMTVFCTDGDLNQIVKDNVMLLRNIKSADAPYGEFVITFNRYVKIFEPDAKSQMLGTGVDLTYYKQLFSLQINGNGSVKRKLHEGINLATPFKVALVKSICGDKKDNLFSIMGWPSTTGTKEFKITENHLIKALEKHKYVLSENICQQILTNKDLLSNLMITLREVCKQKEMDLQLMGKHLKHNLKMNVLSRSNVPVHLVEEFERTWDSLESNIMSKFDASQLKLLNVNQTNKAINVMESSIPQIL